MVLTRYKQRLIFPTNEPDARRYSLLRETISSRRGTRSQGTVPGGSAPSTSTSGIDLSIDVLRVGSITPTILRSISLEISTIKFSETELELFFSNGASLQQSTLILTEPQISIARSLLLGETQLAVSHQEMLLLRALGLINTNLALSEQELSQVRSYLLSDSTARFTTVDVILDFASRLSLDVDVVKLSEVNYLFNKLLSLGTEVLTLTSTASLQRVLYLNPTVLLLDTNTLPPYNPDLTQYFSPDTNYISLSEVSNNLTRYFSLTATSNIAVTDNQPVSYLRQQGLNSDNLRLTEIDSLKGRALGVNPDYINLYEERNSLVRYLAPSLNNSIFTQVDITTSLIGNSFLLEQISSGASSNVLGAFSVARRLTSNYNGNLIRLRRASDNAESNFGFDSNGDLDEAAVETWAAGTDAYVTTVYNQAGSAVNLEQSTSSNQVIMVSAGNLFKYANRPAAGIDGGAGAGRYLGSWGTSPRLGSKDFAIWIVHERNAGDDQPLLTNVFAGGQGLMWRTDGYLNFQVSGDGSPALLQTSSRFTPNTDSTAERKCIVVNHDYGLSSAAYVNSTTLFGSSLLLSNSDYDWNGVGSYFSFRAQYKSISEFIIFNSQIIGSSDLSTLMTNGTSYYT